MRGNKLRNGKCAKEKRPAAWPAFLLDLLDERRISSTRSLAAARHPDLFLQSVKPDRADHDLLPDHVARRAIQAHVFGKLEVLLDRRLDLRASEILLDPGHVEA